MESKYKNKVKPLKVEYRTSKALWADGPSGGLDSNAHAQEMRNAELQWRAISPKLLKAANELLGEFAPKLTESVRRFAAHQSRSFGMAAGELQPLDKSLTPRNNTTTRPGVFKLPKKMSAGFASTSFGGGAKTGLSSKFAALGLGGSGRSDTGNEIPSPSDTEASSNSGGDASDTAWGAPVSDYNPFHQ